MTTKNTKAVEPAQKAGAIKRPQPHWLQRPLQSDPAPTPERTNQSQPRLLGKAEILTITGVSFPTVWQWMRAGAFPRSRVVGGKSMWLSTEIDAWLAALPVRPLKGDKPLKAA